MFLSQLSLLMFAALCSLYTTLPTVIFLSPAPRHCRCSVTIVYCICINIYVHVWNTSLRLVGTVIYATCRRREIVILEPVSDAKKSTTTKNDKVLRFRACQRRPLDLSLLQPGQYRCRGKVQVAQRDIAACEMPRSNFFILQI